jgi:invasion protein IalB
MQMSRSLIVAIALPLLGYSTAYAQTQAPQVEQSDSAPKTADAPQDAPGNKVRMFGDWALVCGGVPGSTDETCEVDATLRPDTLSPPVAKIAFVRGAKDEAPRIVAIVAANLTLEPGVEIANDSNKEGVILAFKSCLNDACLADLTLTADQLQSFRSMRQVGRLQIKNAGGQPLSLKVPFAGLSQALDALLTPHAKQ